MGLAAHSPRMLTRAVLVRSVVVLVTLGVGACSAGPRVELRTAALYPTLAPISRCEVTAGSYSPDRGDVVTYATGEEISVRRVVGLAGDKIAVTDGVLHVSGVSVAVEGKLKRTLCLAGISPRCECEILTEEVGGKSYPTQRVHKTSAFDDARCARIGDSPEAVVPQGHVFVLADNRDAAPDSRATGPVKIEDITGRVVRCR